MLFLLSDGLTTPALLNAVPYGNGSSMAAVVVMADHEYKERNYHIPRVIAELESRGYKVEVFDLDVQPAEALLAYDLVEFIGGNPYYLLYALQGHNAEPVLKQLAAEKILIGWSAGAVVMEPSIGIIDIFTPEMNLWGIEDLTGMGLTDLQVLPHYSKLNGRFDRLEERCQIYESEHHCKLLRLSDGEGTVIDGQEVCFL